jgi:hypothetical protein
MEPHLLCQALPGAWSVPLDLERDGLMAEESKGKSGRLGKWREKRRERRERRRRVDAKRVAQGGRANVADAGPGGRRITGWSDRRT